MALNEYSKRKYQPNADADIYETMGARQRQPMGVMQHLARVGASMGAAYGGHSQPEYKESSNVDLLDEMTKRKKLHDLMNPPGFENYEDIPQTLGDTGQTLQTVDVENGRYVGSYGITEEPSEYEQLSEMLTAAKDAETADDYDTYRQIMQDVQNFRRQGSTTGQNQPPIGQTQSPLGNVAAPTGQAPIARSMAPFSGTAQQAPGVPLQPQFETNKWGDLTEYGKTQLELYKQRELKNMVTPVQQAAIDRSDKRLQLAEEKSRLKIEKDAEKEKARNDVFRADMEENLRSVRIIRKGIKYFGPMGDLPSILTPSGLLTTADSALGGQLAKNTDVDENYGERKQWESEFQRLISQRIIDLMGEMKRVSQTGATGFGQLSNKELGVLREASTALTRGMMPKEAAYYLDEMERIYSKVLYPDQEQAPDMQEPDELLPQSPEDRERSYGQKYSF